MFPETDEPSLRGRWWSLRPIWWWFALHGSLALGFGIFTLLTPPNGEAGFLLDGAAFATLAILGGAQVAAQSLLARHLGRGWAVYLAIGLHAVLAGIVLWVILLLGTPITPYTLFWSIFGFLTVQGVLLALGLLHAPLYRLWGLLMGICMVAAAAIMACAWVSSPGHSFDIPDTGMGIAGLMYGIAVLVAALQARAHGYARR